MPTPPLSQELMDEALALVREHGSVCAAARASGINRETLQSRVRRACDAAGITTAEARQGWSPAHDMTHTVPDGYVVKGVSTYYDKDGQPKGQWVKSSADRERQHKLLTAAVEEMGKSIPPVAPVPAPASQRRADLLNTFVITDYHLGALAWGEETGADWDVKIAERLLIGWFGEAIRCAPPAETAVLANLGDFLHFDGLAAITPTSGHILDADTRFQHLIRTAIRVLRTVTTMLLQRHGRVLFLMAEGNHDMASSAWLRELFAALYADEPRIEVIVRPDPYYCIEWGNTSLFFHHGHKRKLPELETVLIAKFREVFGRTKYSYTHTGHLHHDIKRESNTMILEQHRTLAAPDSHASRGGWLSGRDAKVITYSKDFGEVSRITISAAVAESAAKAA